MSVSKQWQTNWKTTTTTTNEDEDETDGESLMQKVTERDTVTVSRQSVKTVFPYNEGKRIAALLRTDIGASWKSSSRFSVPKRETLHKLTMKILQRIVGEVSRIQNEKKKKRNK